MLGNWGRSKPPAILEQPLAFQQPPDSKKIDFLKNMQGIHMFRRILLVTTHNNNEEGLSELFGILTELNVVYINELIEDLNLHDPYVDIKLFYKQKIINRFINLFFTWYIKFSPFTDFNGTQQFVTNENITKFKSKVTDHQYGTNINLIHDDIKKIFYAKNPVEITFGGNKSKKIQENPRKSKKIQENPRNPRKSKKSKKIQEIQENPRNPRKSKKSRK